MSLGLRIILDKSVVVGLNNSEIDSLDRYFFQIVPPILLNEICADLSKATNDSSIKNSVSLHSYRISGNRGLAFKYREILGSSLIGNEVPMEGKFFPVGERMVRMIDGSVGTIVETIDEDETIFRWQRKDFTEEEKLWAIKWRRIYERPINSKMYTDKIAEAGLDFKIPKDDKEIAEIVDSLLQEKRLQSKLLVLLAKEFKMPFDFQRTVINRWYNEGKPMIKDFAPYAFFCVRANFLWAIGLTNQALFKPNKRYRKNDRKDLEYCYYLPHCEIFASKDNIHKILVPHLLRPDQSFVDSEKLKIDLNQLSEDWNKLSRQEQIKYHQERGFAPPENEKSLVFQLWKKHQGEIKKSFPLEMLKMKVIDSSLPENEQVEMTFQEMIRSKWEKYKNAENMSPKEIDELKNIHGENNPATALLRTTKMSRERFLKLNPQLKESDLDE